MTSALPRLVNDHVVAGSLLELVRARHAQALARGALEPLQTRSELLTDGPFTFVIRELSSIRRKRANVAPPANNPFLPHDPALFVSDLTATHHALLNKYNVLDLHVLIVTRAFEHQERLLTLADFEALAIFLVEYEGLGFYNGGAAAGASQVHKHLQYVTLPLAPVGDPIPVESGLLASLDGDAVQRSPLVPWNHRVVPLDLSAHADHLALARDLRGKYEEMIVRLHIRGRSDEQARAYNLLVGRRWMMAVPRSREHAGDISINALGFGGTLLAADARQRETLVAMGAMSALRQVTEDPDPV